MKNSCNKSALRKQSFLGFLCICGFVLIHSTADDRDTFLMYVNRPTSGQPRGVVTCWGRAPSCHESIHTPTQPARPGPGAGSVARGVRSSGHHSAE